MYMQIWAFVIIYHHHHRFLCLHGLNGSHKLHYFERPSWLLRWVLRTDALPHSSYLLHSLGGRLQGWFTSYPGQYTKMKENFKLIYKNEISRYCPHIVVVFVCCCFSITERCFVQYHCNLKPKLCISTVRFLQYQNNIVQYCMLVYSIDRHMLLLTMIEQCPNGYCYRLQVK